MVIYANGRISSLACDKNEANIAWVVCDIDGLRTEAVIQKDLYNRYQPQVGQEYTFVLEPPRNGYDNHCVLDIEKLRPLTASDPKAFLSVVPDGVPAHVIEAIEEAEVPPNLAPYLPDIADLPSLSKEDMEEALAPDGIRENLDRLRAVRNDIYRSAKDVNAMMQEIIDEHGKPKGWKWTEMQ